LIFIGFRCDVQVVLLVSAFLSHGPGQFSDGPLQRLLLVLMVAADGVVDGPLPTAGGACAVPGAVPPLGGAGTGGGLPSVQQRLVAGQLVQQGVDGGGSSAISVKH